VLEVKSYVTEVAAEMRILLLIPRLNRKIDSNFFAFEELSNLGNDVLVLTSRHHRSLKGDWGEPEHETTGKIETYRLFDNYRDMLRNYRKQWLHILELLVRFKPEVVFCSEEQNIRLAILIRKHFDIPILTLVEVSMATAPYPVEKVKHLMNRVMNRHRTVDECLFLPFHKLYWNFLLEQSDVIITCHPQDEHRLPELSTSRTKVHYVPWCNQLCVYQKKDKIAKRGIYIGSLSKVKNSREFSITIPRILDETPTEEFIMIGPAFDGTERIIKKLITAKGQKVRWIRQVGRTEALSFLSSAYWAYTPVDRAGFGAGWGFIIDAWGAKTPVLATHNNFDFHDRKDAMVVSNATKISKYIGELYDNKDLYIQLQNGGYERYKKYHTAEHVARKYLQILKELV